MKDFTPDYNNILDAARNVRPKRIPLYEHIICDDIMEKILNIQFKELINGDDSDKKEYFRSYTRFFKEMGYDTVSFERCIVLILPGSGALADPTKEGVIKNRDDFEKYPWDELTDRYFRAFSRDFELLREVMPEGMKAIGGPGNGVFECVQDLVGYTELCFLSVDDPDLFSDLFIAVGKTMYRIWNRFLEQYGDIYAVCRFGDDLGFKTTTLLQPEIIKNHIIPQYKKVIELVHSFNKPFLLHSCGRIFDVMEDLINVAKIDAKHSNEDQIAPFSEWVDRYGDRIGNFGGVDTDHLCRKSTEEIREIVKDVMTYCNDKGGFALGSGNSIPDYVPVEGYLAMVEAAREFRLKI